ncbi:exo-beta-N-acetylmuramidase NamZ domain-containing protein [Virgibacillus byunsanensis]|uniref:Exo-beta-N-acetylmuramidase NamZ domain-containing protein n=1 Tax=Virgibacillus byunsanensis TaxID=570945 RepID=A0ABW3LPL9_9BACI
MKKLILACLALVFVAGSLTVAAFADNSNNNGKAKGKDKQFQLGVEVLLDEQKDLIEGKRVGLITNPTGVDKELNSIVDRLHNDPDVDLTSLYGPEHGVRGNAQAGDYVEYYIDETTGLPVYSLYGQTRKPTPEMLENVDVLLFDIQDVGTRFYTYIYTMAYAMEAAQENDIEFMVLDRPNPLSGAKVEGPVLDPDYASFVGNYPIPLRHGMTVGELAKLFNKEFDIGADLTVVEMNGWKRNMYYDDTPLEFVLPSPNMPTFDTAMVYPGAALIEGTNLSEGRGTTKPFELIGAPYVNSTEFAAALNDLNLPGVSFRAASFTPSFSKHSATLSNGVQIHVDHKQSFHPVETGLHIVKTLHDMYPEDFAFRAENSAGVSFFDNLIGNGWIREAIENGESVESMKEEWGGELEEFKNVRENYLVY